MYRWRLTVIVILWLTILTACGRPYQFQGIRILNDPQPAPDFTLTDHHEQSFRLSDQTGKIVVLFFGFTTCPDVCPTALSDMAYVRQQLGVDAATVQMVFITVDPARDTSDQMARYLSIFDSTFIGVRGDDAALAAVMKDYGAAAFRRELPDCALGYTMDHTASLYVIDKQGRWFGMYGHGEPLDPFIADLRYLANQ